jgi:single-stranded-DNA-specific exonuclease
MQIFDRILAARGLTRDSVAAFLNPDYSLLNDPFLLPDIDKAMDRLLIALSKQEKIVIYGDYDIDGLTSTALLYDVLENFGFSNVSTFIPNRFTEGYGLNLDAVERIARENTNLIITVDCGSRSYDEIVLANELGVDIIITDHHETADIQPPAIAVINPKRIDSRYPFRELAGVGVVFKLVQALQQRVPDKLKNGQEKWLLDLVALGTICDVVPLVGENRVLAYFGLRVLPKTRRIGLQALMKVAQVGLTQDVSARTVGFVLGPRMNAAGRLETAQYSLDMLTADDTPLALEKASRLDELNIQRRSEQSRIQKEAEIMANADDNPVLVLSSPDWNHGVVGIVAARLLEKYKKPTFIFQEMGEESKGSARSFGDFSAVDGVDYCRSLLIKGGGHKLAAGVTLKTENIAPFRERVNKFYKKYIKTDQSILLLPKEDTVAEFWELTEELVESISRLEPFGNENKQPVLMTRSVKVCNVKRLGSDAQHVKIELIDQSNLKFSFLAFNAPENYFVEIGARLNVWYCLDVNEWKGRKTLEGKLLHLELVNS